MLPSPSVPRNLLPPTVAHLPSYAHYQPQLRQPPAHQPDLSIPSAHPPGPVPWPPVIPSTPTTVPVPTTLQFAPDAAALGAAQVPPIRFTAPGKDAPSAAQFRIGIDAGGAVRYCFRETSSGDPTLDEEARHVLLLCRFPAKPASPSDEAIVWTTATFQWGNDLVVAPVATTESPRP